MNAGALLKLAAMARIAVVAAATTGGVYAVETSQDRFVILAFVALMVMIFSPFLLGLVDGHRAVLVAALIVVVALVIASQFVERSTWGPCVLDQAMDGNSPSPCRGDLHAGGALVPATWLIITGSCGACLGRALRRASEPEQT